MYKAEFDYNASAHRQSMKMMVADEPNAANPSYNLSYTRYYVGDYEKEVRGNTTTEVCYISTPAGLSAAYVTQNNTAETYYLHTDHLGSIIGVSNNNQQKIYEASYDAWGKKRPVEFWFPTDEPQTAPSWLWRGYTGHEHLPEFGLINMNARLYDPILGRMLSPDNYVQDPNYSQSYNRYSYCWNNPLKYTDPTGNFTFSDGASIVLIVAGVAICVTSSGVLAAVGVGMIVGGVSHFGYTLQDYSNGMSWDDASNKNGVSVGVKFDVNMSGGPKKSTPPPPVNHHSSPAAPTSNLIAGEKSEEYYSLTASGDPSFFWGQSIGQKSFPTFSTISNNYQKKYSPGPYSQELYYNQCAIRLSVALNKSGVDLRNTVNYTNPGGQTFTSNGEVLGAYNLAISLQDHYLGTPSYYNGMTQDVPNLINGQTGIIYFEGFIEDGERSRSARHIDLWNGSGIRAPYYEQMMDSRTIWFWPIK